MLSKPFSAAMLLVLALSSSAVSGPVTDAAAKVDAAIAAGDFNAWFQANEDMLDAAWTAAGLHFARMIATTTEPQGYGVYEPRPTTVYGAAEPIYYYVEPRGYGYGDLGGGLLEIAFDIDLRILDPSGAPLLEQPNFAAFALQTRVRSRELMVNLTANFDGAPAGDYTLEFTFHDRHGGQSASFTAPVTLQ